MRERSILFVSIMFPTVSLMSQRESRFVQVDRLQNSSAVAILAFIPTADESFDPRRSNAFGPSVTAKDVPDPFRSYETIDAVILGQRFISPLIPIRDNESIVNSHRKLQYSVNFSFR